MFIRTRWEFGGLFAAALVVVSGCSQSSNPVAPDAGPEQPPLEIPSGAFDFLEERSAAAKTGAGVVVYTFDDLPPACLFNTTIPSVYHDLTISDSRLIARCSFDGGIALVPTDLAKFNSGTTSRTLITLPGPATEVSVEVFGIRNLGPRTFVAYDAAGVEIDRDTYTTASGRVVLTVTGAIFRIAIIDFQSQTYWDNLTVTYGAANQAPVARAASDHAILVGETVTLDGSASSDPDGDALAYEWSWLAVPAGSEAALVDATSAVTAFTADLTGTYTVQLIVNDGSLGSDPATLTVVAMPLDDGVSVLRGEIEALVSRGELGSSQAGSLFRMLDFVQRRIDSQPHVAANKLHAFSGHVGGLISDGVLGKAEGDALIDYADRIAAALTEG